MTLTLQQTLTAVGPGMFSSFAANGGTLPYVYSVAAGGAGGTIVASGADAGNYTAPSSVNTDPAKASDTIVVTDDDAATASASILVGTPLLLFCEIIQRELNLTNGRVYLWDQKINQPSDSDLYVAVSFPSPKVVANVNRWQGDDGATAEVAVQYVLMAGMADIDIISRGPAARDRKEEVVLALNSTYAQKQQDACSFYIGKQPTRILNLSNIDGAAIPYRYRFSVALQYAFTKPKANDYFGDFPLATPTIDP